MQERRFPETDLYCLTASEYSLGRANLDVVRQMLENGIRIIQYREKDFNMRQKYRECLAVRELCKQYQACFIVNDDVHLAIAVGADGVHVGQDDLPVEIVRRIVGDKMIIGLSTHSPEQADLAVSSGVVDYIGVGPIFKTSTKKGVCAPVSLSYLDYVVAHHRIPFVAIGGVKLHNIASVAEHGAGCIALVTEIVGAEDIGSMIRTLRAEMAKGRKYH
jgi:thiamine-phosphate pyrophosphorylase